jgi:hypothetical protein
MSQRFAAAPHGAHQTPVAVRLALLANRGVSQIHRRESRRQNRTELCASTTPRSWHYTPLSGAAHPPPDGKPSGSRPQPRRLRSKIPQKNFSARKTAEVRLVELRGPYRFRDRCGCDRAHHVDTRLRVCQRHASCDQFAILDSDLPMPARAVVGVNAILKHSHVVLLTTSRHPWLPNRVIVHGSQSVQYCSRSG